MNKKIDNYDEPIGQVTRVEDFLPPPDQLTLKEDTVNVILKLSKASIEFFKNEARKSNLSYQRVIQTFIDQYVQQYA